MPKKNVTKPEYFPSRENLPPEASSWPACNPTLRNVDELAVWAKNSRTHSDKQLDQIAASIKQWGFTNPVLVDEAGTIIAGHGRVAAAKLLGFEKVPCITATGWTHEQKQAYVIADNQLALNAGWNMDTLAEEMKALEDVGFDVSLIGFDDDFLDMLNGDSESEGLTDEDDVPEVPAEPVTTPGDIWQLGAHRVMCGDSTSIDAVEKLMDGAKADLLLTDPPYNVAYEGKTKDALKIQNDSMTDDAFRQFLRDAFTSADAVMRPGAVFYVWHADSEGYNFRGACHDAGWKVRQCIIWAKNTMVLGRQDYQWKHEPCLYGWKDGAAHYWGSDRKQTTLLEFNKPARNGEHPTMKPVELMEYQVKNSTRKGDLVLDLFLGSGSTLIAAEKTGRRCYGTELDPKYVDVIIKRWQEYTGKQAIHVESGKTFNELSDGRG